MPPTRDESFEALFRENYAAVRGYALRRASPEAAQDVVAETFLVAWRRLDDVPADALPWLLGVARRVLANDRRGQGRREALLDRLARVDDRGSADVDEVDPTDISPELRTALDALPPAALEALLLIAWEELTPADAAKALGCSQATFRARLYRARRALARALESADLDLSDDRTRTSRATLRQEC